VTANKIGECLVGWTWFCRAGNHRGSLLTTSCATVPFVQPRLPCDKTHRRDKIGGDSQDSIGTGRGKNLRHGSGHHPFRINMAQVIASRVDFGGERARAAHGSGRSKLQKGKGDCLVSPKSMRMKVEKQPTLCSTNVGRDACDEDACGSSTNRGGE